MCISAGLAMLLGTAASTGVGLYQANQQRKDAKGALGEAQRQQAKVDTDAAQSANARIAARKKALQANSLVTGGGDAAASETLNGGKALLGGG